MGEEGQPEQLQSPPCLPLWLLLSNGFDRALQGRAIQQCKGSQWPHWGVRSPSYILEVKDSLRSQGWWDGESSWALKEGMSEYFLSFRSPSAVCLSTVGTVYCSMEKYELLLPDKPSYRCWKPVQREQRRLLFSEWVEPGERGEAPSGWSWESLLGKNVKLKKNNNTICSLN